MASSGSKLFMSRKSELASAINEISSFLAQDDIHDATALNAFLDTPSSSSFGLNHNYPPPISKVVVFCASAVLRTAETVFAWASIRQNSWSEPQYKSRDPETLQDVADEPRVEIKVADPVGLILCGGVGHSTTLLYDAVKNHPIFRDVAEDIRGKPEARVLQAIAERFYGLKIQEGHTQINAATAKGQGLLILVEDKSTNCGANASETRKMLDWHGITSPQSIIVVQDPTMCRRTVASFQQTYKDNASLAAGIFSWPTFVPQVCTTGITSLEETISSPLSFLAYKLEGNTPQEGAQLWGMSRFIDLIMGEIPRLRDDAGGYGPNGRGFIAHVDIPLQVEASWLVVDAFLLDNRETESLSREMDR